MKIHKKQIGLILLFLIGLSILLYPTISDKWNQYRAGRLIAEYAQTMSESTDFDAESYLAPARRYNESLVGSEVPDAFSVREGIRDEEYESLLAMNGDGMMGYVEIPSINVNLPIYHYTSDEVLEKGVGHLFGSSLPIGGESTHAVLSAHRGLPSAKMFTDLNLLKEGDLFYIQILGETLAYEVDQIGVVEPDEVQSLMIEEGKDYVTLFTCTPYAVNTQRLLVRGYRVPFEETAYEAEYRKMVLPQASTLVPRLLCVAAGILIAVLIVWIFTARDRKNGRGRKNGGK